MPKIVSKKKLQKLKDKTIWPEKIMTISNNDSKIGHGDIVFHLILRGRHSEIYGRHQVCWIVEGFDEQIKREGFLL